MRYTAVYTKVVLKRMIIIRGGRQAKYKKKNISAYAKKKITFSA